MEPKTSKIPIIWQKLLSSYYKKIGDINCWPGKAKKALDNMVKQINQDIENAGHLKEAGERLIALVTREYELRATIIHLKKYKDEQGGE